MKTWITGFIATTILATSSAYALDAEFHPSTYTTYKKHGPHSGNVQVMTDAPGGNQYTEIGIVRVDTQKAGSYEAALASLKNRAARHGGTALILQDDAQIFAAGGMTDQGTPPKNCSAIAIRY